MRHLPAAVGLCFVLAGLAACKSNDDGGPPPAVAAAPTQRTIVMVWDGLRPDSINAVDTPNLYALRQQGVAFADHHSTYPTFTMMNGSSFATGSFPKTSGFYGNTFWTPPQAGAAQPIPVGKSATGANQDYVDPVFTEDYAVLTTLNDYYGGQLLLVRSLFKTAQDAGLKTLALGKSGAAYIQDLDRGGYFVDENTVLPQSLATELQTAGFALPLNTTFAYPAGTITLASTNGNPTARAGALNFPLPNGTQAKDATDATQGAPEDAANKYMLSLFTQYILPKKLPDLTLIWFRTPDNSEHAYGPGSTNYRKALASQDARLGELQAALKANGLDATTNIVVVSDHAHSNVSGPTRLFPLRAIVPSTTVDRGRHQRVARWHRPGQRLLGVRRRAGRRPADVRGLQGVRRQRVRDVAAGRASRPTARPCTPSRSTPPARCAGPPARRYQAISATLPTPVARFIVPRDAARERHRDRGQRRLRLLLRAGPRSRPPSTSLVRFLQSREEFGAIFVDSRYGAIPGTLPMSADQPRERDATEQGPARRRRELQLGLRSSSSTGCRASSSRASRAIAACTAASARSTSTTRWSRSVRRSGAGSRSPIRPATSTWRPTVAQLFGLSMPAADGRVLNEALVRPTSTRRRRCAAASSTRRRRPPDCSFKSPIDPTGATVDTALGGTYSINLVVKDLTVDGKTYRYFDFAQPVRN